MIKIRRITNSGIVKTDEGNYETTVILYCHDEPGTHAAMRDMIKSLYPRKYEELGGDNLVVEGKAFEYKIIDVSEERVRDIITELPNNESMALLYSKSEFDSVKDFVETSLKWFDYGMME
jgi:hypothetical protein